MNPIIISFAFAEMDLSILLTQNPIGIRSIPKKEAMIRSLEHMLSFILFLEVASPKSISMK